MRGEQVIEAPRRLRKHPQTIWLETNVFAKILELASQFNVAPNVICAEIIKRYINSGIEPLKVIEKTVEVPSGFYCPMCESKFKNGGDLLDHMRTSSCRKKLLEWLK